MTPQGIAPGAVIGVIGLGRMGRPIASRMHDAGFEVRGYDVSAEARAMFAADGGRAESDAGALADADAVVLLLPDSTVVERVLESEALLARLRPGTYVVDMGSSSPTYTRELAAAARARGIDVVDAPVSGGVEGALEGTLTVMVGATATQFAYVEPLLLPLAAKVVHVGAVGAGHAMKALNNLLSAASMLATTEALGIGAAFGIEPETMLEVLNSSSGRSFSTEVKFPRYVLPGSFDSGFTMRLMAKDAQTAVDLGRDLQRPVAFGALCASLWAAAAKTCPSPADHTEIARWLDLP